MATLPLANSDDFASIDDCDLEWASKFVWRKDEDGHIIRDSKSHDDKNIVVYLCNEVICRRYGYPLSAFGPPTGAFKAQERIRKERAAKRRKK